MAKMLTQVMYDLQKNKKLSIYTSTNDAGGSQVIWGGEAGLLPSINGEGGGMVKFYPSGSTETMTYVSEKLTDRIPSLPTDNITYLDYVYGYPTSQNYSLLNDNVEYKMLSYDPAGIILGTIPNIVSIMYSAASEPTILQQFGIVGKDLYYDYKYAEVASSIGKDYNYALRDCVTLGQLSNNKSQTKMMIYASGQVLCSWGAYTGGTADAFVTGIQYISRGYDVNYYNQTVIPVSVTSSITSVHTLPVQDPPSVVGVGTGGYTNKSFTNSIISETSYDYMYYGEDPLQLGVTTVTDLYSESMINLTNFVVVAHIQGNTLANVYIANRAEGVFRCGYAEYESNNYETIDIDGVGFQRLTTNIKARWEDCLIATIGSTNVLYPASGGVGAQSGLATIFAYMKTEDREALLSRVPEIPPSSLSSYYSKFGAEVRSLLDLHVIQDQGSFHILNSELNVHVSKERLERSITKCVPLGKTMSHRVLYSERVGEIKQDFDSKEYIGGPVPLKTETIPTYPARASAGGGDTVQNVGYGNAIYYGEGDIQTIADNFAAMNDQLSNISISFKGPATIRDLEDTLAGTFILDSASQDIGRNMTTFNCRAVIF